MGLIIASDDYVASIQPDKNVDNRYEQGVMVSLVDDSGRLVPEQNGKRGVTPAPTLIRKGLACEQIMAMMSECFLSWDFRRAPTTESLREARISGTCSIRGSWMIIVFKTCHAGARASQTRYVQCM